MIKASLQEATFTQPLGLAEKIANHVQKQIVSEALPPGARISEASITSELGVSRGPVRESMRILVRRHLVELMPRKGARVTDFGVADVNNLYDLQQTLLSLLITKVITRWQEKHLEEFAQLQQQIDQVVSEGSALDVIDLSFRFQWSGCQIVDNSYLTSALLDLQPSFSRAYYRAMAVGQEEMQSLSNFISNVTAAIVDMDGPRAVALVESYSEHQRNAVLQTFGN